MIDKKEDSVIIGKKKYKRFLTLKSNSFNVKSAAHSESDEDIVREIQLGILEASKRVY